MDVLLVMFKADGNRRDFPVRKGRVVVGRKNTCDLRIPLSSVSRQHCEIRIKDNIAKLRDLGSSNGTYHNSTRIQEVVLSAGDEVVVGPVVFTIVIDGHPEDVKPVRTLVETSNSGSVVTEASFGEDEPVSENPRHHDTRLAPQPRPHGSETRGEGSSRAPLDALSALEAFSEDDQRDRLSLSDSDDDLQALPKDRSGGGKS